MLRIRPDAEQILDQMVRDGKVECGFLQHADGVDLVMTRLDRDVPKTVRVRFFSSHAKVFSEIPEVDALIRAGSWRVMD